MYYGILFRGTGPGHFRLTLTGQMKGLGLMVLGVILLLAALMIYNKPFEGDKGPGL